MKPGRWVNTHTHTHRVNVEKIREETVRESSNVENNQVVWSSQKRGTLEFKAFF